MDRCSNVPLNWNQLWLFNAVASTGSVTAAAQRLRLTQPSISRQIHELEATLGTTLLERLPRGVRLTESGELLASYTRRLFALAGEAEQSVRELSQLARGRLRIAASMTIGVYLLPQLLADFRRRWPAITLEVTVDNTDAVQHGLREFALDLGLTEGPGRWEDELGARTFLEDELVPVASPRAAFSRKVVSLAHFLRQPLIMREPGSGTRAILEAALARHGFKTAPEWIFNNPEAIKRAVMAGAGVAFASRLTVASELSSGQLREVKIAGWSLRRDLRLQWRRGRAWSAPMHAFAAVLPAGPAAMNGVER